EAAREFEVSADQMRSMLATLTVVGEPAAGYYTGEMFDIDWDLLDEQDIVRLTRTVGIDRVQRFTPREAAALIAGLQLLAAVAAVAADGPRDDLRAASSSAVRGHRAVRFGYTRPDGGETSRTVDPSRLLLTGGEWYLQGWCHLRRAPRTFHLERMSDLVVTDDPAAHADEGRPEPFAPGGDDVIVTLRFPTRLRPLLADLIEHAEIRELGPDTFARIPLADAGVARRVAARGGGDIEVVAPQGARDAARDWAAAAEILSNTAVD